MKNYLLLSLATAFAFASAHAGEPLFTITNANNTAAVIQPEELLWISNPVASSSAPAFTTSTAYTNSFFDAQKNVGNNNPWTYTLTFTAAQDMCLTEISIDFFTHSSTGGRQTQPRGMQYTLNFSSIADGAETTLFSQSAKNVIAPGGAQGTTAAYASATDRTIASSASSATETIDIQSSGPMLMLQGGTEYKLTIDLAQNPDSKNGTFIGVGDIRFIPEPAGSSLALFGAGCLLARRRRRS